MEFNAFESIKIGLASPEQILKWSFGEVKKPETINYRTQKPERDGLFCERIFGPQKDWECYCGKYKRLRYKDKVCERCGVAVTTSKVRRERMGHIKLAAPVSHIWYFKGIPSRMGLILDMSPRVLEKILYFASYVVIDPGHVPTLKKKQELSEQDYRKYVEDYGDAFKAGMGAEAIQELLAEIDLDEMSKQLKAELAGATGQSQKSSRIHKKLEVVESFRASGNRPEWMILTVLPVIPPDIRPMVRLDGGRYAASDLNDLYRRVISRNNRLQRLLDLGAPDIIVRNEKRMLQEAVDALIDNGRRGKPVTGPNNRPLKSLSDMLKGKQGRFRQNLLGKRVDYSGRSVIVVGPELQMYQCGLPKEMAIELFKPFVMKRLVDEGKANNIKNARKKVERADSEVWDALAVVIKDHPVLLNRAPTLHRLGIQAFEPVLVEGRALKLHPLACTAYNADFDGDQMAVHVPLSAEAQAEARFLMLATNNLLKPSDGKPVTVPTQDMVLGSYYLTMIKEDEPGRGKIFRNTAEALMAYQEGCVGLHAPIKVRVEKEIDGELRSRIIDATVGQIIFNDPIPQDLGYVDRTDPEKVFDLEITTTVGKSMLGKIVSRCIEVHGTGVTAEVLDRIKAQGFKYSTRSGITVAVIDAVIPPQKAELLKEADEKILEITDQYNMGVLSDNERYKLVIDTWNTTTDKVGKALQNNMDRYNPIFMMADSGARGSMNQIRQLAGMRGLIANTSGRAIEIPIKANYREGLNILEYFISSRGARKGLADTALRTADSGYLTRRLVDVSQEVITTELDCGAKDGIILKDIKEGNQVLESLATRLHGRYLVEDILDPETGEVLVSKDKMMDTADADKIVKKGFKEVLVRSPLKCECKRGVCCKCYGMNLAKGKPMGIGEAVGIIAAQSIGEPGTQLTMRTFHTGGIASAEDITQGLPRVEELFEARRPKRSAIIAKISGMVSIEISEKQRDDKEIRKVRITPASGDVVEETIPYGYRLKVNNGEFVEAGTLMTEGSAVPKDILQIRGVSAVQDYLIEEVQKTYQMQGVDINDKHIEVIVRQMLKKVRLVDAGDTGLIAGGLVEKAEVLDANKVVEERIARGEKRSTPRLDANSKPMLDEEGNPIMEQTDLRKASWIPEILGISKAASNSESFLSAASFQETPKILTDAAIKGKTDPLAGIKENVIIGKLIPAGTGMNCLNHVDVVNYDGQPAL